MDTGHGTASAVLAGYEFKLSSARRLACNFYRRDHPTDRWRLGQSARPSVVDPVSPHRCVGRPATHSDLTARRHISGVTRAGDYAG